MNQLKSIYVSAFITASLAGFVASVVKVFGAAGPSPWLGTALACASPLLFFIRAYTIPIARTTPTMPLMRIGGALGTAVSIWIAGGELVPAVLVAGGVGILAVFLYIYWYSRFAAPEQTPLKTGAMLPAFNLLENGERRSSNSLTAKAGLWIFYRGNWCPLCMAQIGEVSAQYRELAKRGVDVFLISPQPEANTASLAKRFDVPMRFMTDVDNAAARVLGIVEKAGLPAGIQMLGYGSDVPRPTVLITAAGGELIYCDLSENYRVRPEPAEFLAVLDGRAVAAA